MEKGIQSVSDNREPIRGDKTTIIDPEPIGATNRTDPGTRTGVKSNRTDPGTGTNPRPRSDPAKKTRKEKVKAIPVDSAPGEVEIIEEPGEVTQSPEKQLELDASQTAAVLLALLNSAAIMAVGPSAEMLPAEYTTIEPPLSRLIKKYGVSPETVGRYADPLMLAAGLGMWYMRVKSIRDEKRKPPEDLNAEKLNQSPELVPVDNRPVNGNGHNPDIGVITAAPVEFHKIMSE